jgi:hypothetical protein
MRIARVEFSDHQSDVAEDFVGSHAGRILQSLFVGRHLSFPFDLFFFVHP